MPSTISTSITKTVTLGNGTYTSPLTITSTGQISVSSIAVLDSNSPGTVTNAGTVTGGSDGIYLEDGGSVANKVSGKISGNSNGIIISDNGLGNVYNAGSIHGTVYGIELGSSDTVFGAITGNVTNTAQGTISGSSAVYNWGSGTIYNAGLLSGGNYGAKLFGKAEFVTNSAGGVISGKYSGITSYYGTTILNAGTIIGAAGLRLAGGTVVNSGTIATTAHGTGAYAVQFQGNSALLVADPGGVFIGDVVATGSANIIELASAANSGTITGIGTSFQGFGSIAIDTFAAWTIAGDLLGTTISGLTANDTLDLTGVVANSETYANGVVRLYENNSYKGSISVPGIFNAKYLRLSADKAGTGTDLYVAAVTISGAYSNGITLNDSVTTIAATARIDATNAKAGVYGRNGQTWQVINDGSIVAANYGVYLFTGSVTNAASGVISGSGEYSFGIFTGDLLNLGTITSQTGGGVYLQAGTVTNAGTIASAHEYAVNLGASNTQQARLIIDPGAVFIGNVLGNVDPSLDTLELAAGSKAGTITGIGKSFTGFGTISIDASAAWVFAGTNALTGALSIASGATLADTGALTSNFAVTNNGLITTDPSSIVFNSAVTGTGTIGIGAGSDVTFNASVASGQTIVFEDTMGTLTLGDPAGFSAAVVGFHTGNTIGLTGIFAAGETGIFANNIFTLLNGSTTLATLTLAEPAGLSGTSYFAITSDQTGGTDIVSEIPCFAAGTRILGIHGEFVVEDICPGDVLVTVREHGPVTQKVIWTGRRAIDIRRHPEPNRVRPICILAGAIAENIPERDLRLSPEHAIYLNGVLFTAESLINGTTIFQEQTKTHVTYHHIELETHDIILAEGLSCESFLDTGNRKMFDNISGILTLHPDFRPSPDAKSCAPLIREGQALEAIRLTLTNRAQAKPKAA